MYIKIQILKTIFVFTCVFLFFLNMGYSQVKPGIKTDTEDIEIEKTGSFKIVTDVSDLKIYINGNLEGLAHSQKPLIREYVPVGTIIVTAKPENLPSISRPVVISSGKLSELELKFIPEISDEKNIRKIPEHNLSLEQLISQGDKYFQNERYMTPENENAFEMYKAALELAPENDHIRENIYEMFKIYENLGIENENKNYAKALVYYQNHVSILEYCLNRFQEFDLKEFLEQAEKKVNELKNNIELSNKLAEEADSYFIAQKFTTPKDKNAFLLYKASLEANPTNEYSEKRIKEIIRIYKKQGDQAFQKGALKKAARFYKKYIPVAEYALLEFNSKRIKRDLEKIKKRVE